MEIFLKKCCKCKIEKTLDRFSKNRSRKDGLCRQCKDCQKTYWHSSEIVKNKKEERRKRREAIKLENQKKYANITSKICSTCKEEKLIEFFGKQNSTKDGYRNICKKCKRIDDIIYKQTAKYMEQARKSRKRRSQDPERKQREKEHSQRPEVVAKRREQSRLFNQTPEGRKRKKRLNQLPSIKACKRRWKQNNPEKVKALSDKRRAIKLNAPGEYTDEHIKQMLYVQERKCWFCKSVFVSTKLCKKGYHVEHRIPLSRGGTNFPSNLCLSCPNCNYRKWMRTEQEFIEILRQEKELKNIETKIEEKVDKFVSKILLIKK